MVPQTTHKTEGEATPAQSSPWPASCVVPYVAPTRASAPWYWYWDSLWDLPLSFVYIHLFKSTHSGSDCPLNLCPQFTFLFETWQQIYIQAYQEIKSFISFQKKIQKVLFINLSFCAVWVGPYYREKPQFGFPSFKSNSEHSQCWNNF